MFAITPLQSAVDVLTAPLNDIDRRRAPRWVAGDAAPIVSLLPTNRFGLTTRFVVRDLSPTGVGLQSNREDAPVLVGLCARARMDLPTVGKVDLVLDITHVRRCRSQGRMVTRAGARIRTGSLVEAAFGTWLARFGPVLSPAELVRNGLLAPDCRAVLAFAHVSGEHAPEVEAFTAGGAGRADVWVTARHQGRLVAATGVRLGNGTARVVAATVDPNYRTSDLELALWQETVQTAMARGARWMDGHDEAGLWPFVAPSGRIALDLAGWVHGAGQSPSAWRRAAEPVLAWLRHHGIPVQVPALAQARAVAYGWCT